MKTNFILIFLVLSVVVTSEAMAEIVWSGKIQLRYSSVNTDDKDPARGNASGRTGLIRTEDYEAKYLLNANGGWDNIEWGLGIRGRGNQAAPNAASTSFRNGINDNTPTINEGWLRYVNDWGFGEIGITAGKQQAVFRSNSHLELLLDSDVRFDGLSQSWSWGSFGLNFGQYILGSSDRSAAAAASSQKTNSEDDRQSIFKDVFAMLYTGQMTFDFRFFDEVNLDAGLGILHYNDYFAQTNTLLNQGGSEYELPSAFNQIHTYFNLDLPYMFTAHFEWVLGLKDAKFANGVDARTGAIAVGASFGKLRRVNDYVIHYHYRSVGLAAVHDHFTWNRFAPNSVGHVVRFGYNLMEKFSAGLLFSSYKEDDRRQADGLRVINNEHIHTTRVEVTTTLKF